MLVFARPGCENGAEKLCEIAADIQYLNECVIPEMRKAGIKSMTIGEIVNFARLGDMLKCGFCPREIKTADYIIDIGPEGGDGGGTVVACGTPEEVADNPKSYTGQYVKRYL